MGTDLRAIFKAYDVRGVYPDQFDEDAAYRIGRGFARWCGEPRVLLGRDCRTSSPALAEAFATGVNHEGVDVVDLGLATTDMVYFASGRLGTAGAMFTASHNPPEYNGLKLCRAGAAPVGSDSGLEEVRALAEAEPGPPSPRRGGREERSLLGDYLDHVLSFADVERMAPLVVAADAANGMAGLVVPPLFERLPCRLIPLYMELDGTFPNHPADPIQPENQADVKRAVMEHRADLGLAFDGDADRVFFVDERGEGVSGSLVTALVAIGMLEKYPGATILYNAICSWVVPEVVKEHGGVPVRTRVGHSFIKKVMAETGAVFGGEHSGHYYFRDHYRADSGLVAAMVVMDRMSKAGQPLSELLAPLRRYHASGEINSEVADQWGTIERIAAAYPEGRQDRLDGLTVEFEDWWFNVRPSNTEPLLRLNVEARTRELLEEKTAEVLALIRGSG
ncbi:MAG TPA: phosphomannomutase/phosphoglucomutase [Actinomycetota bacterium]|nr:phosphomannomutase/phosphoglucomutase [Actinomycetota bacterium]